MDNFTKMQHHFFRLVVLFLVLILFSSISQAEDKDTQSNQILYILDASGSMWGQIDGKAKISIAKNSLVQLVQSSNNTTSLGLMAYGHRRKADCTDIELITPLQSGTAARKNLIAQIQKISPKGKTPLAGAVNKAVDILQNNNKPTTIILISDGKESCHLDPCSAVKSAKDKGINFVMHTIGFSVDEEASMQLKCMAKAGHGKYFKADNAQELLKSANKATKLASNGKLKVEASNNGKAINIIIRMHPVNSEYNVILTSDAGVKSGAQFDVPAGEYKLEVSPGNAMGIKPQIRQIKINSNKETIQKFDFSLNEIDFSATENGVVTKFKIKVNELESHKTIFDSDTFSTMTMNGVPSPYRIKLNSGKYKIIIRLADKTLGSKTQIIDTENLNNNTVDVPFLTGQININVKNNNQSVMSNIAIYSENETQPLYASYPYVGEKTPIQRKLIAGKYKIEAWPIKFPEATPDSSKNISVSENTNQTVLFDYDQIKNRDEKQEDLAVNNKDFEQNTDRPGMDYKSLILKKSDPSLCYQACSSDKICKAWTYIKPNTVQGPYPKCWLKISVPDAHKNECCVSGIINR